VQQFTERNAEHPTNFGETSGFHDKYQIDDKDIIYGQRGQAQGQRRQSLAHGGAEDTGGPGTKIQRHNNNADAGSEMDGSQSQCRKLKKDHLR